jgi:hypothetical protein
MAKTLVAKGSFSVSRFSMRSVRMSVREGRWKNATSRKPNPPGHDRVLDLVRPIGRRLLRQVAVEPDARGLHLAPLAQVRGRRGRRARTARLPFLEEGPVRDVRRDEVLDRPDRLDLAPQRLAEARRRMEPHPAGGEADHGHPDRQPSPMALIGPLSTTQTFSATRFSVSIGG